MPSLKAFIPRLAGILNTTPAALYERQRALVREGLLTPEEGRGRGSGVRLSAEALAVLLIGLLVTDSLAEVASKSADMAEAKPWPEKKCPITGKSKFKDAFAAVLEDRDLCKRVNNIKVSRSVFAEIKAGPQEPGIRSCFFTKDWDDLPPIWVEASIGDLVLSKIAEAFHDEDDGGGDV